MNRVSEWLFASTRRLVVTVGLAVMTVILGVTAATSADPAPQAAPVADAPTERAPELEVPADAPTPVAPSASAPEHDHGDADAPVPRRAIKRTARAYLAAFHDPTGTERAWRARVDALSTDSLARLNATVPYAAVPAAQVQSVRIEAASYSYGMVTARMSGAPTLRVALVLDENGWRVTEVAPVGQEAR